MSATRKNIQKYGRHSSTACAWLDLLTFLETHLGLLYRVLLYCSKVLVDRLKPLACEHKVHFLRAGSYKMEGQQIHYSILEKQERNTRKYKKTEEQGDFNKKKLLRIGIQDLLRN
ncbi:uncharacterized protein LOC128559480 [Mercenaria mercenaria]|uniref:uncharacterized protein LOC128559480 n=1 Tax=Mercenaria mercenaria TaxID=6596 RepID=UPI00234F16AA|nr:uncharacterized protein LOC128559480 [Mercenaria mercenaria]